MYTAMPIEQIDSGLAWSVFLSTMIIHITVVNICCRLMQPSQVSKQKKFEHCDDKHHCL